MMYMTMAVIPVRTLIDLVYSNYYAIYGMINSISFWQWR